MIAMSCISSFTFRFAVEEPIVFQSFSGFAACGVFYTLVRSVDESLAEELHSSKKLAPWASSPVFVEFPSPRRIVYRRLDAPSVASVTFAIVDERLSDVLKEAILRPDLHIELANVRVKVISVLANTYSFSDMVSDADPLPKKFAIKFLTPTAFRRSVYNCCPSCPHYAKYMQLVRKGVRIDKPCEHAAKCGGVTVPLPIPSLMFRNLARMWSAFSKASLNVWDVVRWAEEAIMVSGFPGGIRTVLLHEDPAKNKWIVGFVGTVRFAINSAYDEKYAKAAAALLKMAELMNVGVRRTAGLGMIRILKPEEIKPR